VTDALADTSIFVAAEAGRPLARHPDGDVLISIAALTELRVGVLLAGSDASRGARTRTLAAAQRFVPLGYDERVSDELATMIAALRAAGRRVNLFDAIIAATAAAHGLPVWTQDSDFAVIERVAGGPQVLQA
jgi:predicted nucleic acid-binding protein